MRHFHTTYVTGTTRGEPIQCRYLIPVLLIVLLHIQFYKISWYLEIY